MSKLRDRRARHDVYYRRAKQEQFAARSVYKLQEIDRRFGLLAARHKVLDIGCRPGSWLQYAAARVGPHGVVVGLDRDPIDIALPPHVRTLVGDALSIDPEQLRGELEGFDLVLSDMAPDTIGVAFADQVRSIELCGRALELALLLGRPDSAFVGKLFMGDGFAELVARAKGAYRRTKTVRPEASRKGSRELYLVAMQLRTAVGPATVESLTSPREVI